MRNRILILGVLVTTSIVSCGLFKKKENRATAATEVNWVDFTTGYAQAKKDGKILLVDVYTDWCGWCKVMDKKTYTDSAVIQTLDNNYVCVKLNPEKAINYTMEGETYSALQIKNILSENRSDGYPSTYFMKPSKAKKVVAVVGYQKAEAFDQILRETVPNKL